MDDRKIGLELRALHNTLARYTAHHKKRPPVEMTEMHAEILGFLLKAEGEVILQKDIEQVFTMRKSTASRMLQLIERKGLIERVATKEDARQKQIVLTEKAHNLRNQMETEIDKLEKTVKTGISDEDLDIFFKVIEQIKENLRIDK